MCKEKKDIGKSLYEKQEHQLSAQSDAFIRLLTKRGILEDQRIGDEHIRQVQKEKARNMYHNKCFPDTVAEELDRPLHGLDALLNQVDLELGMDNRKLESRLDSVRKSRLLLDRINEALSVLKRKPGNGAKMYELIYLTYLGPDKLSHTDLLYRLDISSRHYYRLRQQAITILSIRLWSAPASEVDSWLEVLTLLEHL